MSKENNMKNIFYISIIMTLCSCGGENNLDEVKFLSCQINSSHALYNADRQTDIAQCWNTSIAYTSQVLAVQSCGRQVDLYLESRYEDPHTVTYSVESSLCPTEVSSITPNE
jgi:ABC-type uncharacterized transport system auxiliary subunit